MTRSKSARRGIVCCRRQNCTAVLISLAAVSFLYFNFEPISAGADAAEADFDLSDIEAAVAAKPMLSVKTASQSRQPHNASPAGVQPQAGAPGEVRGQRALLMNLLLLEHGRHKLAQIPSYTATFYKNELVGGSMTGAQVMQLKVRHEPFSVYMKWMIGDKGRELLYVNGQNSGDMLVKVGGWKGKMLPALKLNPTGSVAMNAARYPVTKLGLLELTSELIAYRRKDLENYRGLDCRMVDDQKLNGRKCYCFVLQYENPKVSELYRKTILYIDHELCLPVSIKNYSWPSDEQKKLTGTKFDEATLIEQYAYTKIRLTEKLADAEFDRKNKNYRFARR